MTAENGPSQSSPSPAEAAAREPSMDDILASIRRIIADDDVLPLSRPRAAASGSGGAPTPPVRPPAPLAAAADVASGLRQKLFPGGGAAPESTSGVATAPVFRPPAPRVVSVADNAPSLNLRDFAPAARRPLREALKISAPDAPEQQVGPADSAPREGAPAVAETPRQKPAAALDPPPSPALAPQPAAAVVPPPAPVMAPPPAAAMVPLPSPSVAPQQPAASVAQLAEARLKAAAPAPEAPAAVDPPAPAAEAPAEFPRPAASRRVPAPQLKSDADEPVLLSSASGARIGASFEALAESLMLRDPEMIERVAREMLRPMLKAWLDDNLPVVVERLVRVEIERIARGRG
jgi:cell pole-organizing protein PopZ